MRPYAFSSSANSGANVVCQADGKIPKRVGESQFTLPSSQVESPTGRPGNRVIKFRIVGQLLECLHVGSERNSTYETSCIHQKGATKAESISQSLRTDLWNHVPLGSPQTLIHHGWQSFRVGNAFSDTHTPPDRFLLRTGHPGRRQRDGLSGLVLDGRWYTGECQRANARSYEKPD